MKEKKVYTMKKERIDALSDGIFAIVMTLLIIEIRVPELQSPTHIELLHSLVGLYPLFLSYIISFALLFTYWRAHNYIISVFAKNIDTRLANYNALFFLFVALTPFSSHFLGRYSSSPVGVMVIGLNTVLIGLSLYAMRNYVISSKTIENIEFTPKSLRHGTIRILMPTICAAAAMGISLFDITIALGLLTFAILFNLVPRSADLIDKLFFYNVLVKERD